METNASTNSWPSWQNQIYISASLPHYPERHYAFFNLTETSTFCSVQVTSLRGSAVQKRHTTRCINASKKPNFTAGGNAKTSRHILNLNSSQTTINNIWLCASFSNRKDNLLLKIKRPHSTSAKLHPAGYLTENRAAMCEDICYPLCHLTSY